MTFMVSSGRLPCTLSRPFCASLAPLRNIAHTLLEDIVGKSNEGAAAVTALLGMSFQAASTKVEADTGYAEVPAAPVAPFHLPPPPHGFIFFTVSSVRHSRLQGFKRSQAAPSFLRSDDIVVVELASLILDTSAKLIYLWAEPADRERYVLLLAGQELAADRLFRLSDSGEKLWWAPSRTPKVTRPLIDGMFALKQLVDVNAKEECSTRLHVPLSDASKTTTHAFFTVMERIGAVRCTSRADTMSSWALAEGAAIHLEPVLHITGTKRMAAAIINAAITSMTVLTVCGLLASKGWTLNAFSTDE